MLHAMIDIVWGAQLAVYSTMYRIIYVRTIHVLNSLCMCKSHSLLVSQPFSLLPRRHWISSNTPTTMTSHITPTDSTTNWHALQNMRHDRQGMDIMHSVYGETRTNQDAFWEYGAYKAMKLHIDNASPTFCSCLTCFSLSVPSWPHLWRYNRQMCTDVKVIELSHLMSYGKHS